MGTFYALNVYTFYFKFCMEIWKNNVKKESFHKDGNMIGI